MNNAFDNTHEIHYYDYRGNGVTLPPPPYVVENDRKKRVMQKSAWCISAAVALVGLGYWLGMQNANVQIDDKVVCISPNGIIHNRDCRYFNKNSNIRNCQFCGGLKKR